MIQYLEDLAAEGRVIDEESTTFLDLGTGNGQLLIGVRDAGFQGHLTGIDYSEPSVEFAKKVVVENEDWDPEDDTYEFRHADFLGSGDWSEKKEWDVVMDKGTLDAIALANITYKYQDTDLTGVELYPIRVAELVKSKGLILITSCNFTEEELIKIIESDKRLKYFEKVEYPTFEFGGVKGQTVCTIAFRKE